MRRSLCLLAALFSVAFVLAPSAWAQENATITGTVVDPTGAVVPNAAINLKMCIRDSPQPFPPFGKGGISRISIPTVAYRGFVVR